MLRLTFECIFLNFMEMSLILFHYCKTLEIRKTVMISSQGYHTLLS